MSQTTSTSHLATEQGEDLGEHLPVLGKGLTLLVLDTGQLLQQLGASLLNLLTLAFGQSFGTLQNVPSLRQALQSSYPAG
ncbi:hypothetical protein [Streptomyces sp. NPDC002547]